MRNSNIRDEKGNENEIQTGRGDTESLCIKSIDVTMRIRKNKIMIAPEY